MEPNWLVLLVFNQTATKVEDHLRSKGVEVYLPMVRSETIARGKRDFAKRPLFPGYAFARSGAARYIEASPYPFHFLNFGEDVATIDNDQIASLQRRHDTDGCVRLPKNLSDRDAKRINRFRKHQNLRVLSGPFTGFDCLCERMSGHERVVVLLKVFGRTSKMELAADSLEAA